MHDQKQVFTVATLDTPTSGASTDLHLKIRAHNNDVSNSAFLKVFFDKNHLVSRAKAFAKESPAKGNAVHQGAPTMMSAPGTWQRLEGPKFLSPWFGSGNLVQFKNSFIHVDESAHESADGEEDKPKKSRSCPDLHRDHDETEARCLLVLEKTRDHSLEAGFCFLRLCTSGLNQK